MSELKKSVPKAASKEQERHEQWVRQVVNLDDRHDSVPSLNGVEVGSFWRNRYTRTVEVVVDIRLGGAGTYLAHGEAVMMDHVDEDSTWLNTWPLESLVEHWYPVARWEGEMVEVVDKDGQVTFELDVWQPVTAVSSAGLPPYGDFTEDAGKTRRDRREWKCAVIHDRPQGGYREWTGQGATLWRLYENDVLTVSDMGGPFLSVGSFKGMTAESRERMIHDRFPDSVPAHGEVGVTASKEGQLALGL